MNITINSSDLAKATVESGVSGQANHFFNPTDVNGSVVSVQNCIEYAQSYIDTYHELQYILAIVTIIAVFFIWQSFKLQREIQRNKNKLI